MDDTPPSKDPKKDFNKLDLSQLQQFSFGTQWSQDKTDDKGGRPGPGKFRDSRGDDRPQRDGPGGADNRRDRRTFRRPAGAPADAPRGEPRHEGPAGPRPDAPRFDGPGGGAPRGERRGGPGPGGGRPAPYRGRERPVEHVPYVSPYIDVTFYPEDVSFDALAKTIRSSCRTFELFDIAKTVIGKNDRFVVVAEPKAADRAGASKDGAPVAAKPKFYLSVPDGLVFESEDAAVSHVMQNHLQTFFDQAEVQVDPPKGSFQVINRCGLTGALLGPPNYHRYNQMVQQHHAKNVSNMSLEAYRSRIESVRDEEVVNQWLESQKTATRFTLKGKSSKTAPTTPAETVAEVAPAAEALPTDATPASDAAGAEEAAPSVEADATPAEAAEPSALTFDNIEDARTYLLTNAREKIVRVVETARFHGKILDLLPDGEIKAGVIGALERQRRFPLDTANALRGRLRREGFTIFKKGSKGVSYVCAVKRKFRIPGQTFAESIGELIDFIEAHPMIKAGELPEKFLGLSAEAKPAASAPAAATTEGGEAVPAPAPASALSVEDQRRLSRMQGDLRWLVMEGYVTEFMDGAVFAAPPLPEPKKPEPKTSASSEAAVAAESDDEETSAEEENSEVTVSEPIADATTEAPAAVNSAPDSSAEPEAPADDKPKSE